MVKVYEQIVSHVINGCFPEMIGFIHIEISCAQ